MSIQDVYGFYGSYIDNNQILEKYLKVNGKWIVLYPYNGIGFSNKKNELLIHKTIWTNLKRMTSCKRNQSKRSFTESSGFCIANWSVVTEADLWEGKMERSREELYIFMRKLSDDKCFMVQLWWWFHMCLHISKFIRLFTMNMCSLLHINYKSIKLLKWTFLSHFISINEDKQYIFWSKIFM